MRNDLPQLIGSRVRELRQTTGISQEELAERADLHRNYISSVERGQRDVGVGALHRIATALDSSLAEFFRPFGAPSPNRAPDSPEAPARRDDSREPGRVLT